jgi:predicted nucleotidyltransferase
MFEKILKKLAAALAKAGIPYMIIGGQAVLLYGEPRLTRDIDVTLGIGSEDLNEVLSVCKKIGLKPIPKKPDSFVSETMVLPASDSKSGIRVDFVFSFTPYETAAIRRARKISIGGRKVCFASPEDVIIHKIFAGRPRDLEDVRGICLKSRRLNMKYIVRWLKEFDRSFKGKRFLDTFRSVAR